ncbi:hypothetical protein SteCoe_14347 [Stentor coeruleus]|uniref:BAH domain-containing protein n=1 Tax=Stentor coeruleus TaxID=5963 RepID=A0A1R2C6D2_9CILI|nr:hypothetical protein SteCoe_14347 [Stentor coeruleus]
MSISMIRKKIEYKKVIINSETYRVGDSVKINERKDDCLYAEILSFWQDGLKPDAYAKVRWYFKPSEIFEEIPDFISAAELMTSNVEQNITVQSIYDRVTVLNLSDYHENDLVDDNIMFSRSLYDPRLKVLRPPLSQWKRVCVCESILNPDEVYVGCDGCFGFFHPECVIAPDDKEYICDKCSKAQKN